MLQIEEIESAWRNSLVSGVPPSELVLVTDFDGRLAEIVADPEKSAALDESLEEMSDLGRLLADVIVLSSRTAEQLEKLVPVSGVRLIGDSGRATPRHAQRETLDRFNADVAVVLERIPGAWLEGKPSTTAIHFRKTELTGQELRTLIHPALEERGLVAG